MKTKLNAIIEKHNKLSKQMVFVRGELGKAKWKKDKNKHQRDLKKIERQLKKLI